MRAAFWLIVPGLIVSTASSASAFCRAATRDPDARTCPDVCAMQGIPLAWRRPNVDVKLNVRGFPGFTDDAVRAVAQEAFDAWTSVTCEGAAMGMTVNVVSELTEYEVGPKCDAGVRFADNGQRCEPNDNTLTYFAEEEWLARGYTSNAFALTSVWYKTSNGEIVGADTHFNGAVMLSECPATGCRPGKSDLLNVATHEAGHFFGLAHSEKTEAAMWCDALPGDLSKRALTEDDLNGVCSIYGVNANFDARAEPIIGTCSVQPGRDVSGWFVAACALAVAAVRRRSKRLSPV